MKLAYKSMTNEEIKEALFEASDEDLVDEVIRLSYESNYPHEVGREFDGLKKYLLVTDLLKEEVIGRMSIARNMFERSQKVVQTL